jgi:hypothetical protein
MGMGSAPTAMIKKEEILGKKVNYSFTFII